MKNHRDVCYATNAGYVEYAGLPGQVRTGCPNTPDYKSLFCALHKPAVAVRSTRIEESQDKSSSPDLSQQDSFREPIGLIIGKQSTRNSTLYQVDVDVLDTMGITLLHLQVVWLGRPIAESTWEHSTSLPSSLVSEHERGILRDVEKQPYHSGGQTICVLRSICTEMTVWSHLQRVFV